MANTTFPAGQRAIPKGLGGDAGRLRVSFILALHALGFDCPRLGAP